MTVRVFQSTDNGAPVLGTTNDGSLITILRACLIDGYGSRTPQGWSMPFSDLPNKIACFQSVSGDTLRVDDSLDYRWATVTAFKTMTDVNTGTEEYPNSVQLGTGREYRAYKRYNNSSAYTGWILISSDNWFYFYNIHNSVNNTTPSGFFFGEYKCLNPSFAENYLLTGVPQSVGSASTSGSDDGLFHTSGQYYVRRNYQNAENPVELTHDVDTKDFVNPNPFTGSLELTKPDLRTTSTPLIRYGYFPNLWKVRGNNNGYIGGEKFSIDNKNYIIISNRENAFAIEYNIHNG
jgi:hypothetical protein